MRFDDAEFLARAYGTDEGLSVRIETHRRYSVNAHDVFEEITTEALKHLRPERVLDVGAGNGNWYRALRRVLGTKTAYVGLDQSDGMVRRLQEETASDPSAEALIGNAQALPWTLPTFDWVGMHFMLYHVPDIRLAIAEAWRVLVPGGLLLAATVTRKPYRELLDLQAQGLRALGYEAAGMTNPSERFSLEDGAQFFPAAPKVLIYPSGFRFDAVDPALQYLASGPVDAAITHAKAPGTIRGELLRFVGERIAEQIEKTGSFIASSESGFFLLQKPVG
ncbi:MAG: class I SAM-dependent methyltransferase [Thermaerobacter sp.]|nr:class I SAM-dependent methyltransferase [Thermaerobacter sp.]